MGVSASKTLGIRVPESDFKNEKLTKSKAGDGVIHLSSSVDRTADTFDDGDLDKVRQSLRLSFGGNESVANEVAKIEWGEQETIPVVPHHFEEAVKSKTTAMLLHRLLDVIRNRADNNVDNAVYVLWEMSHEADFVQLMANPDFEVLPLLADVIRTAADGSLSQAVATLWHIMADCDNILFADFQRCGLVPCVVRLIRSGAGEARVNALGLLWSLCRLGKGSVALLETGIFSDVIGLLRACPGYPNLVNLGITVQTYSLLALLEVSALAESRAILQQYGVLRAIAPMVDCEDMLYSLIASTICLLLDPMLRPGAAIYRIIELLDNTLNCRGGHGYEYGAFHTLTVLLAIAEAALVDETAKLLATPQVRDLVQRVLSMEIHPTKPLGLSYRLHCASVAAMVLFRISFVEEDDELLTSESEFLAPSTEVKDQLKHFVALTDSNDHELLAFKSYRDGLQAAKLLLQRLSKHRVYGVDDTRLYSDAAKRHVMLSYCADEGAQPHLVADLAFELRQRGYEVWRDSVGSAYCAPVLDASTPVYDVVEHSCAVVICLSKEYRSKSRCRLEANYASLLRRKGHLRIIFVAMQGDATAQSLGGYLSSMIGSSPCHPCFHQDSLASACAAIAAVLKAEGRTSANRNDKSLHLDFTQREAAVSAPRKSVVSEESLQMPGFEEEEEAEAAVDKNDDQPTAEETRWADTVRDFFGSLRDFLLQKRNVLE